LKKVDPNMRENVGGFGAYYGDQPFTSGPVYVGAIMFVLSVLGMFVIKGPLKWALFIGTLLSIMLAWGKNFMGFSNIFFDYVPAYNKFRAVSMILVLAELTIPLLAILAVDAIIKNYKSGDEPIKVFGKEVTLEKNNLYCFWNCCWIFSFMLVNANDVY
jgi:hypothetical protein